MKLIKASAHEAFAFPGAEEYIIWNAMMVFVKEILDRKLYGTVSEEVVKALTDIEQNLDESKTRRGRSVGN